MNQQAEPSHVIVRLSGGAEVSRPHSYSYLQRAEREPDRSEGGALVEYWQILRRRKLKLFIIALLGGVAAVSLTVPQTPIYQAKATLEIQALNENFLNMGAVNPTTAGTYYTPEYDIQTQVRVLQSRSTLEGALARVKPGGPIAPTEAPVPALRKVLGAGAKPASNEEKTVEGAERNLKVRARPNTRLVEVTYDSSDPTYASSFVNALTSEVIDRNLQARWDTAQHTSQWLTRQMEDMKSKLERSEENLQSYARSVGLAFMGEKDNLAEAKLRQFQDELSRAQADRIMKQSRYELAVNASIEALPEVLDDAGLKEYQGKLTELRRELAELSASFTGAFPKIKKVEAEISAMETARDKARTNVVDRIRNEFDAARRREKLLTTDYDTQLRLVNSQSAAVSNYTILKSEVDTERQLYESIVQRVKEAGVASALRASNIHIVDAAEAPKKPYKPSLALNTILGLLSGVFAGAAYIIARERTDRSIHEPGDTAVYLETPELGVIPSAESDLSSKSKGIVEVVSIADAVNRTSLVPEHPDLTFWNHQPSALAESFRAILTSILFAGTNGHRPRVLVLSSANPGEGKTMVTSNLAIALARASMRVLVIDGDLRRPRLHDIFNVENKDGFSDALMCPNGEAPLLNLRDTAVPGLKVLPGGTSDDTNLLYTRRLPELMAQLRREFDMVLVDTPPMLHMPDARVLARHADAAVLVVRSGRTTRDAALMARQRFLDDGTMVLGTVLNDWDPRHTSAYGYENYYERYRPYRPAKA